MFGIELKLLQHGTVKTCYRLQELQLELEPQTENRRLIRESTVYGSGSGSSIWNCGSKSRKSTLEPWTSDPQIHAEF